MLIPSNGSCSIIQAGFFSWFRMGLWGVTTTMVKEMDNISPLPPTYLNEAKIFRIWALRSCTVGVIWSRSPRSSDWATEPWNRVPAHTLSCQIANRAQLSELIRKKKT